MSAEVRDTHENIENDKADTVRYDFRFASQSWSCGGELRVTDPAYAKGFEARVAGAECRPIAGTCAVKAGLWRSCLVKNARGTVELRLMVWHEAEVMPDFDASWQPLPFYAAVDSGQCGIFDEARYPSDPEALRPDGQSFYDDVLRVSGGTGFGVVPANGSVADSMGVVAIIGEGDGLYEVFAHSHAGVVDAVCIEFCTEDELSTLDESSEDIAESLENELGDAA
jgi:hypothetical protein